MVLAGEKSVKFRKIYRNEGGFIAVILDKKDLILIDTGEDLKRWTIEAHQRMDIALVAVIELSNIDLGILLIEHMLVVLGPLDRGDGISEAADLPYIFLCAFRLHLPFLDEIYRDITVGEEKELLAIV